MHPEFHSAGRVSVHFAGTGMSYANSASMGVGSPRGGSARLSAAARRNMAAAALLAPLMIFVIVCFFVPLSELLRLSFANAADPLSAYREIAQSEVYRQIFVNTLVLAFNVALCAVVLGYPTAWMLTRLRGWRLSL